MEPNTRFAREMARKVLKDYSLSDIPTDLTKVFEGLNLKYVELNDADEIDGAILAIDGKPAIAVLNKARPIYRQRFTLAHELGHIFLQHSKRDIYDPEEVREQDLFQGKKKPPAEIEADTFASELLVPYDQLKKFEGNLSDVDKLARTFQVSNQAMTLAIMNYWKYGVKKKKRA